MIVAAVSVSARLRGGAVVATRDRKTQNGLRIRRAWYGVLGVVAAFGLFQATVRAAPASPVGSWLTPQRDGVISITPCDGGLCGEIVGVFLDRPTDPTPVDYRGVSQCHLPLIKQANQVRPNLWKGHIVDPRNGDVYGVEFRLDPRGNLALRGFLGVPLLGHTQTWTRYAGPLPPDCRLTASTTIVKQTSGLPSGLGGAE